MKPYNYRIFSDPAKKDGSSYLGIQGSCNQAIAVAINHLEALSFSWPGYILIITTVLVWF